MGEGRVGPRTLQVGPKGARLSRLRRQAQNTLGIIMGGDVNKYQKFRDPNLDLLDQYYEGTQYAGLPSWDDAVAQETYVPVRSRKPRIHYRLAKTLVDRVVAKLAGTAVFPQFVVEDDEDTTTFLRVLQKSANFRRSLIAPLRHTLVSGSCFVRYYLVNGFIKMEWANAKFCYPIFDAVGQLEEIKIKYTYEDWQDKDTKGDPKIKWYQMILNKTSDTLFDNPEFRENVEPTFKVVETNNHNLGWVQGEWFRTEEDKFDPDGPSLIEPILDFLDDFNYSLSQTSQAISYNQEPQLTFKNVDEDELEDLVKSSAKGWNLGREGEAAFLETTLEGVVKAAENRDHSMNKVLDVVRVVILNPEKIVGSASSGKAMEVLHGPLVELIDELRTTLEPMLRDLLLKIALTVMAMQAQGMETMIDMPDGWKPDSLDVTVTWPAIFPPTIEDIAAKATAANTMAQGKLISRETLTRWLAQDIPTVENIEEELQKIESEPDLNPFGSFGGGPPA